jgi:hypothetical protein
MKHDVKDAESAVDMACFIWLHMLGEEDPLGSQFPFLPEVLSPPEKGVDPEDPKDRNQESGHNDEGPIKHGLSFWIIMSCVGEKLNEVSIGAGVAFSTGLYETIVRDGRFGIIRRQNAMKTVAVCTPCYQFWVSQMLNLSMVTLIVGLRSDKKNLISFHHFFVCMTPLTDLRMELLPKFHHLWLVTL